MSSSVGLCLWAQLCLKAWAFPDAQRKKKRLCVCVCVYPEEICADIPCLALPPHKVRGLCKVLHVGMDLCNKSGSGFLFFSL